MTDTYRVGNHQPRNLYRGDEYIGVFFSPMDAAHFARVGNTHLAEQDGECMCNSYEPCAGECCGQDQCSCSHKDVCP